MKGNYRHKDAKEQPERAVTPGFCPWLAAHVEKVLVVELSNGQMVEDVRLALNGEVPVEFYGRGGGNVPSAKELRA